MVEADRVRLATHSIQLDDREKALAERITRIYDQAGFNSPALKELGPLLGGANPKQVEKVITALLDTGRIVDVGEGVVLAQQCVVSAEVKAREFFVGHEQMTASEFRQMLDTSRKLRHTAAELP